MIGSNLTFADVYLISLGICLLTSWVMQLITGDVDYAELGLYGLCPVVNVFAAAITTFLVVIFICSAIISLPSAMRSMKTFQSIDEKYNKRKQE